MPFSRTEAKNSSIWYTFAFSKKFFLCVCTFYHLMLIFQAWIQYCRTPRLQQQGQLLPTLQRGSSDNSAAKDWTFKTYVPHVHKIPHWGILRMTVCYIIHDNGTLPAGLSEQPEPESRHLACPRWGRRSTTLWRTSSVRRRMSELHEFLSDWANDDEEDLVS